MQYLLKINKLSKLALWSLILPIFVVGVIVSLFAFVGYTTMIQTDEWQGIKPWVRDLVYWALWLNPFLLLALVVVYMINLLSEPKDKKYD